MSSIRPDIPCLFYVFNVFGQECNGSSAAKIFPTDWLVYGEMVQQGEQEARLRCCSLVTPVTVALFSGGARLTTLSQQGAAELRGDHSESLSHIITHCIT